MENNQHPEAVHVAVGVVTNAKGEILLARRHQHAHQGGLWEFPGGKLEAGETVDEALRRELFEELAITVADASPLIKIAHDYGDRRVLLDVWRVEAFSGTPCGQENQPIIWVDKDQLNDLRFPAANWPVVAAARLPDCYPIINGNTDEADLPLRHLENLHRRGYRLAQWRVWPKDESRYVELTGRAVEYANNHGIQLLLNADPEFALSLGAAGIHLNGRRLSALSERPLPKKFWVAASCHSREDIALAEQLEIDFAVFSPVLPTLSHPGAIPLGWGTFADCVASAKLPVFALGGLNLSHLAQAKQYGAQGISGIRGFL